MSPDRPHHPRRPPPSRRRLLILLAASLATGLGAPQADAQDDAIASDHYPELGFVILDQVERRLFIELAEGELCPCPGAPRSLSACLLTVDDRCRLAEQVASRMLRLIKEDEAPEQIRDGIVRFITEAQTPRDFDLESAPRLGPADAPITLVVFSDFECPYCRRFATTIEQLRDELGHQLAVYYLHFPLPQHDNALLAARAAIAAQQQGQFWAYHDRLFELQSRLQSTADPSELLDEIARDVGLDMQRFHSDLTDEELAARPIEQRDAGRAAGVSSTPSLFVNGIKYLDRESFEELRTYLTSLL